MGTKTISITDEIYEILIRNKMPKESFSQEIKRIFKKMGSFKDLAGAWSDISEEESEEIKATITKLRNRSKIRI